MGQTVVFSYAKKYTGLKKYNTAGGVEWWLFALCRSIVGFFNFAKSFVLFFWSISPAGTSTGSPLPSSCTGWPSPGRWVWNSQEKSRQHHYSLLAGAHRRTLLELPHRNSARFSRQGFSCSCFSCIDLNFHEKMNVWMNAFSSNLSHPCRLWPCSWCSMSAESIPTWWGQRL